MLKKILGFTYIALAVISFNAFAQNIEITDVTSPNITGTVDDEIQVTIEVMNNGSSAMDMKVKRFVLSEVSGSDNNFCWGTTCYDPTRTISDSINVNSGNLETSFRGDYRANGNPGTSTIRYCFYNSSNMADSACTTINYNAFPVSTKLVTKKENKNTLVGAYPNPAASVATIEYSTVKSAKSAKIVLSNAIGSTIKEVNITEPNGVIILPVSQLESGFYFYSLVVDEQTVATKRLIVNH